ncbi:MAG: cytochrome b N-terminal domain-containing protein [Pseudomonadaceae bacterium]|nr:cytochrome b N-terminal domain-containing protein [Pseudomonadaceae bacterium]
MASLKPKAVEQNITRNPLKWFDDRLPLVSLINNSVGRNFPAPKNLNYMWNFGSLAGIALVIQILTGLFLAMHYKADVALAFDSVQHIMRNVQWGWLIRNLHMVGASFFFIVVYVHMARGLYYGSYKSPREVLWGIGVIIFLIMMATAFMGYVLPWGQMSYWGATVITNLLSVIPFVGDEVVVWIWGGYSVGDPTLTRFYALHFLLPFVIVGIVILHIWALHEHKSNNPTGLDLQDEKDFIPFHPYYTVKDIFGLGVYLIAFALMVFYAPDYLGHTDNYIPANPLVTPAHIVPEWYFLPFYAILRAIPIKELGVVAMFGSILILFVLPWLDSSRVRSARYRPLYRSLYWVFLLNFLVLGWVGSKPPEGIYVLIARFATAYYFLFFALLPVVARVEKTRKLPKTIDEA